MTFANMVSFGISGFRANLVQILVQQSAPECREQKDSVQWIHLPFDQERRRRLEWLFTKVRLGVHLNWQVAWCKMATESHVRKNAVFFYTPYGA
jgi:hypothetical protein